MKKIPTGESFSRAIGQRANQAIRDYNLSKMQARHIGAEIKTREGQRT